MQTVFCIRDARFLLITHCRVTLGKSLSCLSIHPPMNLRVIIAILYLTQPPGPRLRIRWANGSESCVNRIPMYKEQSLLLIIMVLPADNSFHLRVGWGCFSLMPQLFVKNQHRGAASLCPVTCLGHLRRQQLKVLEERCHDILSLRFDTA